MESLSTSLENILGGITGGENLGADGWIKVYDYEKFKEIWDFCIEKLQKEFSLNDEEINELKELPEEYKITINGKDVVVEYEEHGTDQWMFRDWIVFFIFDRVEYSITKFERELTENERHIIIDHIFKIKEKLEDALISKVEVWT